MGLTLNEKQYSVDIKVKHKHYVRNKFWKIPSVDYSITSVPIG